MNIFRKNFRNQLTNSFQKTSLCLLTATLATAPFFSTLEAIAAPSVPQIVAQVPQDWQTGVQLLRLLDNSGNLSSIGILLDIANKPSTTYANAVYQLYVRRSGEWREVYTNSGARLLSKNSGQQFAPVEVIPLSLLSEKISLDDIYNGDLKAVTSVRYDMSNGVKDSRFEIEEVKSFSSIVTASASEVKSGRIVYTTTSTNSSSNTSSNSNSSSNTSSNSNISDRDLGISNSSQNTNQTTTVQTTTVNQTRPILVSQDDEDDDEDNCYIYQDSKSHSDNRRTDDKDRFNGHDNRRTDDKDRSNNHDNRRVLRKDCVDKDGVELSKKNPHRGHFSLAVLQSQPRLSQVIARISLKSKSQKKFIKERFIGDYRFNINQRATFIRGLNSGDRLVVRLFDLQNRPLGYTEVQLLKDFSDINLILPSDPSAYGTLRTVSGIDSKRIGRIDNNVKVYDYFTQTQTTTVLTETVSRFLTSSQGIPLNLFNVAGLPQAPSQFNYTNAFSRGDNSLINRAVSMFTPDMPPVMQVLPGQLASIISIENSQSTIDVVRKILDFKDLRPNGIPTLF
jgi:hypothetical protein